MYLLITAFGACILILLNEMIFTDILKELNNFYPIILNKFQSVDIDNIEDWKFAEIIYKNKYHLQK